MLLKNKICLYLLLIFSSVLHAQHSPIYKEVIAKGDSLLKHKEYTEAYELFRDQAESAPPQYLGTLLLKAGNAMYLMEQYPKAMDYYEKALAHSVLIADKNLEALSLINIGAFHTKHGQLVEGIVVNEKVLVLLKELKNDTLTGSVYYNLVLTYKEKGLNDRAIENLYEALRFFEKINYKVQIAKCYQTLGNIYREVEKDSLSLVYHHKALDIYQSEKNNRAVASVLNDMGNTYKQLYDYEKALEFYQRSMSVGDSAFNAITFGNIAEVYQRKGDYKNAETYYLRAIKLRGASKDIKALAYALAELGGLYVELNNQDKAENFLGDAAKIAGQHEYVDILLRTLELQQILSEKKGDVAGAYRYLKNSLTLRKEVFDISKQEKIEQKTIEFGVRELERENELLAEQIYFNKVLAKKEKAAKTAYLLASVLLVIVVLVLGYVYYLSRKHANWQRTQKIEIQHRTDNYLQTLVNLSQNQLKSITHPEAEAAVRQSQSRIDAMAMIHRSLKSVDDDKLNFSNYLKQLVSLIRDSFKEDVRPVEVVWEIENVVLKAYEAILIGLIVNELVNNAFKYGLRDQPVPTLIIRLRIRSQILYLEIQDNGTGINQEVLKETNSKGLELVSLFVRQLKGTFQLVNKEGTLAKVEVKIKPAV